MNGIYDAVDLQYSYSENTCKNLNDGTPGKLLCSNAFY
jgi:hypothetical protein